jgi:hypothetical protein
MISPKKLRANRANARHSTGPKSRAGKARSAGNDARRHGLAVPVWSDARLAVDAEALAREIAGEGASAHILALARDVAAAQIELAGAPRDLGGSPLLGGSVRCGENNRGKLRSSLKYRHH